MKNDLFLKYSSKDGIVFTARAQISIGLRMQL